MNWVKRLTTVIVILYTTVFPHGVLATDIEQDYTDARKAYLSSWISMAAYNGLIGKVAREELKKEDMVALTFPCLLCHHFQCKRLLLQRNNRSRRIIIEFLGCSCFLEYHCILSG